MKRFIIVLCVALFSINSFALDNVEKHYVDLMLKGDLRSLKVAAKRIRSAHITNTQVLDVAAEVLLQTYPSTYKAQLDTLSWLAHALGQSGNGRYFNVLNEVAEKTTFKKLRRHAKKARKRMGGGADVPQYKLGMKKVKVPRYY